MNLVTPKLVSFDYNDFSRNKDTVHMEILLRQVQQHHILGHQTYRFSAEALALYKAFYAEIKKESDGKCVFDESDQRSVLSKIQVGVH